MITIVPAYQGIPEYIEAARSQPESKWPSLWQQFVIDPYWNLWAAGQHNEVRTREEMARPPRDLDELEQSVNLLSQSGVEALVRGAYEEICRHLPYHDEDAAICIMAAGGKDRDVVGTCIGSSTLLTIPAARPGWQDWVPYVMAHERHHSAWGYHYYCLSGGRRSDLLISLVSEGSADSFAHLLCPGMLPTWVDALTPEEEAKQWKLVQPLLDVQDTDQRLHRRFFFGDAETSTPHSTGYTIGFHIVQEYIRCHPLESVTDWTVKAPEAVLAESGYLGIPPQI